MIEWLRHAFKDAAPQASSTSGSRTLYHWRCPCGARSRGGDLLKSGAEYNAQRHTWRFAEGHPVPEIYTSVEDLP